MKRIITAIGNSLINDNLRKNNKYIIQVPDIQYKEDLIEVLKNKIDTDVLILNISLIEKNEIFNYINEIKKINNSIKIIIIGEKENESIKNTLISTGIKDIFWGNDIKIADLEQAIERNQTTEEKLAQEINNLKNIILENNRNKKLNKNNKLKNKFITTNRKEQKEKYGKIISVIGGAGVGKSIFCSNLALAFKQYKTLIIDFDILNKSIKTIFGVKEKVAEEKEEWSETNLNNLVINLSNGLDLISGIDIIFKNKEKIDKEEIITILNKMKEKYQIILLDTSTECFMDYTKEIIRNSDLSIFLVEANLLELKKSKKLLDIYINNWHINKKKINIVFNKYNKDSIDNNVLKNLFSDFNILGYLKLNEKYNCMINQNTHYFNTAITEEYKKIIEKILICI